jgi:hypothetical protein
MTLPRVFTFWTGPAPSPIIQLCLETIARNAPGAECWSLEQWQAVYDGRLGPWKAIARQRPNVQSDILRAWLLTTYGGIWIDADCILFRDLRPLWQHIELGVDLVTYHVPATKVCTALIAASPDSRIMAKQCRLIARELRQQRKVSMFSLGPRLFRQAIQSCPGAAVEWLPFRMIHPAPWWTQGRHRKALKYVEIYNFHPDAYGFMLTHKAIKNLPANRREDALGSPLPIGQAFRKAFGVLENELCT